MRLFLERDFIEHRDKVQEVFVKDPLFRIPLARTLSMPLDVQREITLQRHVSVSF
jgi:hypothetical protein